MSLNQLVWIVLGIPAIIAWIGYGLAIVATPYLAVAPVPFFWALVAATGWYALSILSTWAALPYLD